MNVLAFVGSANPNSGTKQIVKRLQDTAPDSWNFDVVTLGSEYRCFQADDDYENPESGCPTDRLRHRVRSADAYILASPVYHGSFSGLLKNALDMLEGDAFAWKPVAVFAHGGSPRSGSSVCDQLRTVVKSLSGWSVPTQVVSTDSDLEFFEDSGIPQRFALLVQQLSFRQ